MPVIVEIDGAIHGGSVALPDRTVLPTVVKLDQQGTGLQVEVFWIVVKIIILCTNPLFNLRLIISMKPETVVEHFKAYDKMWFVRSLPIAEELHPGND